MLNQATAQAVLEAAEETEETVAAEEETPVKKKYTGLIVAIAAKREKEISRTFANLERIWDEYNVYEKQVEST